MITKIKDYANDFVGRTSKFVKNEITSEENDKLRKQEKLKNELINEFNKFLRCKISCFDLTVQHAIIDEVNKTNDEIEKQINELVTLDNLNKEYIIKEFREGLEMGFDEIISMLHKKTGEDKKTEEDKKVKEDKKDEKKNKAEDNRDNKNSKGESKNKKPSKAENEQDKIVDAVIVKDSKSKSVSKDNEKKAICDDTLYQLKELWIEKLKECVQYENNLKFLNEQQAKELNDVLSSIKETIVPGDILDIIKTIDSKEASEQFLAEACEEENYKKQINIYLPELNKYIDDIKVELQNKNKPSIQKIEKNILESKKDYPNLEPLFAPDGTVIGYFDPEGHLINPDSAACMSFKPYPNYSEENGRILINNPLLTSVYNAVLGLGFDCTISEQNNLFAFQIFKNDYVVYKPFYVDLYAMLYTAIPKIIIPNPEDTIENSCMFAIDRLDILAAYINNSLTQNMLNEADIINDSYRMVGSIIDLSTVPVELRDGIVKELDSNPTISEALTYDSKARFRFEGADDEKVVFISDSSVRDSVILGTSKRKLQRLFVEPNKVQLVNDETVKQQQESEKKIVEETKQQTSTEQKPKQEQTKQQSNNEQKPKQEQNKNKQNNKKK